MRLVKAAHNVRGALNRVSVLCIVCDKWYPLDEMIVDLDGPAFRAYYCPACAAVDAQIRRYRLEHEIQEP